MNNPGEDAAKSLDAMERATKAKLADILEQAAEIFVDEAKRRVPVRSGELRDDIKHRARRFNDGTPAQMVYVNSRYAAAVEYGHGAPSRLISPKNAKALKTTATEFAASSAGGPAAAKPFMRPAFDSTKNDMSREIAIEAKKVMGRARKINRWFID